MSKVVIQQLIKENESLLLRERRSVDRIAFVRPVIIQPSRSSDTINAFSRDISPRGIGLVSPAPFEPPSMVTLKIHSFKGQNKVIQAESRFCEEFGEGWYLVGFIFR